ncbi:MAG: thiamine pyrophosphate-binding protein [Eubacteriales bacterium]
MAAELNFARAVVRQLASWGVRVIFGVTGNDVLPFTDALAQEGSIRYIGAAHEAGAALMASYHAKLTGELGVCLAGSPGVVNLAEGLADAYLDGAPVLALTGQVDTSKIGTREKQYFNQQSLLNTFTAYSELVTNAPAGLRLLIRAMSQALFKETVAHLSVPKDIWSQPVRAEPGIMPPLIKAKAGGYFTGDLERAVSLMQNSRRPLVLVGSKGLGFEREIRQLTATWGAAVVVAQDAKGVLPDSLPEVLGGIGEAWVPPFLPDVDCILMIGSAAFEESFLPKAAIIQLADRPWQINDLYLWDSLAGDVAYIISTLSERLKGYKSDPTWRQTIADAKKQLTDIIAADERNLGNPVHPAHLMAALKRLVQEDAVITIDEGAFNHWFDRDFQASHQRILLSYRWRSMGAGLPAAIAAQAHYPEKQVITIVGDGGLLMSMGELEVAVKYKLPITILVVNNRLYGLEKDKTLAAGLTPLGLHVQAPDFCRYAQACGAAGFKVEDSTQLDEVLRQALALQTPALVDVVCEDVRLPSVK